MYAFETIGAILIVLFFAALIDSAAHPQLLTSLHQVPGAWLPERNRALMVPACLPP